MRLKASDPTFIDALITPNAGRNDRLDRIDRLIDWPKVAAILDDVHAAPKGVRGLLSPYRRPLQRSPIRGEEGFGACASLGFPLARAGRIGCARVSIGRGDNAPWERGTGRRCVAPLI